MAVNLPILEQDGSLNLSQQPEVMELMETPVELTSGVTTVLGDITNITTTDPLVQKSVINKMIEDGINTSQTEIETELSGKVNISGDTMTGSLILKGDAIELLEPTTLQQVKTLIAESSVNPEDLFKGFISSTEPTIVPKAANFWYQTSDTTPNTIFPWNVKTWDGTTWSTGTTEYTAEMMDIWSNENANPSEALMFLGDRWDVINFGDVIFNTDQFVLDEGTVSLKPSGITRTEIAEGQVIKVKPGGTFTMTGDEFVAWIAANNYTLFNGSVNITVTSSPTTLGNIYPWFMSGIFTISSAFKLANLIQSYSCKGGFVWQTNYNGLLTDTFNVDGCDGIYLTSGSGFIGKYGTVNSRGGSKMRISTDIDIENLYMADSETVISQNVNITGSVDAYGGTLIIDKYWTGSITGTISDRVTYIDQTPNHTFDTFARKNEVVKLLPGGTVSMTGDEFYNWCENNKNTQISNTLNITITSSPTTIPAITIYQVQGHVIINSAFKIASTFNIFSCNGYWNLNTTFDGSICDNLVINSSSTVALSTQTGVAAVYPSITFHNGASCMVYGGEIQGIIINQSTLFIFNNTNITGSVTGNSGQIIYANGWNGTITGTIEDDVVVIDNRTSHNLDTFVRRDGSNATTDVWNYNQQRRVSYPTTDVQIPAGIQTDICGWTATGYGYVYGNVYSVAAGPDGLGYNTRFSAQIVINGASLGPIYYGPTAIGAWRQTNICKVKPGDIVMLRGTSAFATSIASDNVSVGIFFIPIDIMPATTVIANVPDWSRVRDVYIGDPYVGDVGRVGKGVVAPDDGYFYYEIDAPAGKVFDIILTSQNGVAITERRFDSIPIKSDGTTTSIQTNSTFFPVKKGDGFRLMNSSIMGIATGLRVRLVPFMSVVPPTYPMTYPQPGVEQDTGETWIDGRKIYRRCFTGTTSTTNQTNSLVTGLSNVTIISSGGNIIDLSNQSVSIPYFYSVAGGNVTNSHTVMVYSQSGRTTITLWAMTGATSQVTGCPYEVWVKYCRD